MISATRTLSPEDVSVFVRLGELPPLWDFSAVFVANLDCIFFGDPEKTREIIANVTGFHGYGSRLIPILGLMFHRWENLLLLEEEPDRTIMEYFSGRMGLSLPEIEVITIPPECGAGHIRFGEGVQSRIRRYRAKVIDGYVTDPYLEDLARDLDKELINTFRACRDSNDKILFNRFLVSAGLPVFDSGEAEIGRDVNERLLELRQKGYARAAVRAALGASGFGMFIADLDHIDDTSFPVHLFSEGKVLVQGWLEEGRAGASNIFSPSVQFFCGENGDVTTFDITDQLLSKKSIHEGNISPPVSFPRDGAIHAEILCQVIEVTTWVASTGCRGTGSVDFLVCLRDGQPSVYACEVNARVTGATYPSLLALHFRLGGSWLMRNFVFDPCMDVSKFLDLLDREGFLFAPESAEGIMPLNIIPAEYGQIAKCQLLFLADGPGRCIEMLQAFPALLPSRFVFDRD